MTTRANRVEGGKAIPRCACAKWLGTNGCQKCRLFRCPRCKNVVSWSEGGTDDEFCAKCWSETTAKTNPAAPTGA